VLSWAFGMLAQENTIKQRKVIMVYTMAGSREGAVFAKGLNDESNIPRGAVP